ncbi:helix-turn-helix domain-containing protein [Thaumasiovibrio sp. DFM-14]|uniref:helix-turn-helix domain-containing protein n=1 Tax=Thaumasiovibrio sp. DFM-14 TaxID=3384792 RepID=UPI0039A1FF06
MAKKINAYDDEVLSKIKASWYQYKKEHRITQAQAAQEMGMKQSAFSRYLQGTIGLNTDFISRFAQMINLPPAYFHHRLEQGGEEWYSQDATIFTTEVHQTLSQSKVSVPYVIVPRVTTVRGYVSVEIDTEDTRYKVGTVVFFTPVGSIRELDEVGVFDSNGRIVAIGELKFLNGLWKVEVLQNGIPTKVTLNTDYKVMRLEASLLTEQRSRRILDSKQYS